MSDIHDARHLDVQRFASAGGHVTGRDALRQFTRLLPDASGVPETTQVVWQAQGELRPVRAGKPQIWLHLQAQALIPTVCQRCLEPTDVSVEVKRSFLFASTEEQAAALDDECEDEVLVLSRAFDVRELVEDELIMAFPPSPRHERCPSLPPMAAVDPDFDAQTSEPVHAFAVLGQLRTGKTR